MKLIIILLIVTIMIAGCNIENNSFIGNMNISNCVNLSHAPIERFCNDISMVLIEYGTILDKKWGCVDSKGEIHSYKSTAINKEIWIIGDITYDVEWGCK